MSRDGSRGKYEIEICGDGDGDSAARLVFIIEHLQGARNRQSVSQCTLHGEERAGYENKNGNEQGGSDDRRRSASIPTFQPCSEGPHPTYLTRVESRDGVVQ